MHWEWQGGRRAVEPLPVPGRAALRASTPPFLVRVQVHAMAHPPRRRRPGKRVGGILRVHKGFYSAYTGSGYNTVLMGKIKALLDARGGPAGVQMYLTGVGRRNRRARRCRPGAPNRTGHARLPEGSLLPCLL